MTTTVGESDGQDSESEILRVEDLFFKYSSDGESYVLKDVNFSLKRNSRVVLVGLNGAGKSTFLRVLCGFHLASWKHFSVYGGESESKIPWCDQTRGLAYLGGKWTKQSGFSPPEPYSMDIAAGEMMKDWQIKYKERRDLLAKILGVNLNWRMHRVSDGQRKKVRIMIKLLRPFQLCVVDEFAVELDILSRRRFMDFLKWECETRGASVIYATHIFDQVDDWATHAVFLEPTKKLSAVRCLKSDPEYLRYKNDTAACSPPLYRMVLDWMVRVGGAEFLEFGDVGEEEETPQRAFNPYDGGYESGRSKEIVKQVYNTFD